MPTPSIDGYTGELTGRAGQATVRFAGLPYRSRDGKPRFSHGDFGSDLIDGLYSVLPVPRRRLLRAALCRHCGRELHEPPRPQAFELDVPLRGLGSIRLSLEIPAIRCIACGLVHHTGDRQVESDVSDAMIMAFESVGLRY